MMRTPLLAAMMLFPSVLCADPIKVLQEQAVENKTAEFGHWGWEPEQYLLWGSHSNRLIPVYSFGTKGAGTGIDLDSYTGARSPYRSESELTRLYGRLPHATLNPAAEYCDQTNLFDVQKAALAAGKKHIILVVFDGMDWQTTWAASLYRNGRVAYTEGRGRGLHLQDYRANGTTQFAAMVTSPYVDKATTDVNLQTVSGFADDMRGGYAFEKAGSQPWAVPTEPQYLVGKAEAKEFQQAYTDSASSATSMTAGIKTFNAAINVDVHGKQVDTIAHLAQRQGYKIGVVTSVPISHATPAAAYAHNVDRDDYQDLSRDLLGLPSVSHPEHPLAGVDVLIGTGFGVERTKDESQGENFVPGNAYLTDADLQKIDARNGGRYTVAMRSSGVNGAAGLMSAANDALAQNKRLLGFYGVATTGHLPFQTADGLYDPPVGRSKKSETYEEGDVKENPTLAVMTATALTYLHGQKKPFWMMVEAGDVDWANHDNNIDNSIGAVLSGDAAVKAITDWVEQNSSWEETILLVSADHGHMLTILRPELLVGTGK